MVSEHKLSNLQLNIQRVGLHLLKWSLSLHASNEKC
jgi:hypothetical protein